MKCTRPTWVIRSPCLSLRSIITVLFAGMMVAATPESTKLDRHGAIRYSQQEIRQAIKFYAKRYRLEPALLRAVIKVESDFRQDVVSRSGAIGLMQLTPDTAATLRVADPYDSLQNIRGGARQLRRLLNRYEGDVSLALAAYNAGVHRVTGGKIPRIRETRSYVRKVLRQYKHYRKPRRQGTTSAPAARHSVSIESQMAPRHEQPPHVKAVEQQGPIQAIPDTKASPSSEKYDDARAG